MLADANTRGQKWRKQMWTGPESNWRHTAFQAEPIIIPIKITLPWTHELVQEPLRE